MRDDDFEWDDEKAASNFAKHGVIFEQARAAFDDPNHIELDDPDLHEVRFNRLCRYGQHIFMVLRAMNAIGSALHRLIGNVSTI
jgi:uncharacterized DUF497 family protein